MKSTYKYHFRPGYSDTDQMGFVHHSNHVKYFENARLDFFRELDIPYGEIEKSGVLMPVIEMSIDYLRPLFFDEQFTVSVSCLFVSGAKIRFEYSIVDEKDKECAKAYTVLAFLRQESKKPCRIPEVILEKVFS